MALLTWRVRDDSGNPTGPTLYLDFDATLLEEFTRAAEVTRFPVEDGSVLSDHYRAQPRAITLEVQISDTPAGPVFSRDGQTAAAPAPSSSVRPKALDLRVNKAPVTGITGARFFSANSERFPKKRTASVLQFDGVVTRTVDAFLVLDGLMTSAQLVDVLLFRDVEYKDMVITNIRAPRDAQSGSALLFTIDLQQIQFANTDTTSAPKPTAVRYSAKMDAGNRNGTDTNNDAIAYARQVSARYY